MLTKDEKKCNFQQNLHNADVITANSFYLFLSSVHRKCHLPVIIFSLKGVCAFGGGECENLCKFNTSTISYAVIQNRCGREETMISHTVLQQLSRWVCFPGVIHVCDLRFRLQNYLVIHNTANKSIFSPGSVFVWWLYCMF